MTKILFYRDSIQIRQCLRSLSLCFITSQLWKFFPSPIPSWVLKFSAVNNWISFQAIIIFNKINYKFKVASSIRRKCSIEKNYSFKKNLIKIDCYGLNWLFSMSYNSIFVFVEGMIWYFNDNCLFRKDRSSAGHR